MHLNPRTVSAAAAILMLAITPSPALAYMGPGLGLGAVGTALGLIGAILLGLFSVLWYPCKRLFRKLRGRQHFDATSNSLDVRKPRR